MNNEYYLSYVKELALFLLGLFDKAEKLYVQCLDAKKSKLGPDHPDTLESMNGLAGLYSEQGNNKYMNNMQCVVLFVNLITHMYIITVSNIYYIFII